MGNVENQAEPKGRCLIQCKNLGKVFMDGNVAALAGVNLEIHAGEYVAIMGPSGSGKSTLLNLLGGLDQPSTGEIFFAGAPLSNQAELDRIRIDQIAFVFQAFHLLSTLTACENVQIPMFEGPLPARMRRQKALGLLREVGMEHRLDHLPGQLSAGERQRVAIARALANDPCLLLADEPTGNLDTVTGEEVLGLFQRLHQERNLALIVVTHNPEVGERAERLIRLRDGHIIEDRPVAPRPAAHSQP
jgi:ABC-type lipoprotein export system ATPase subunit